MVAKCLIIDDDGLDRWNYAQIIKSMGHEYDTASDSMEGFKKIQNFRYNLVLLDIVMPDFYARQSRKAGIKLLKFINEQYPSLPVIIVSALDKEPGDKDLDQLQISDYIVKGDNSDDEIRKSIADALQKNI